MDDGRGTSEAVVVIACTGAKAAQARPVRDLYQGATFSLALSAALAEVEGDASRVLVLSARHGLVGLDEVLAPYDVTIGDADAVDAETVRAQGEARGLADSTEVYAMVPSAYLALLHEALEPIGTWPNPVFEGNRGIGDQRSVMTKVAAA